MGSLLLRTDNSTLDQEQQTLYNAYIPGIVNYQASLGRQVSFVDLHGALGSSDLSDGIHPNAGGYIKLAAAWFPAITNVISSLGTTNAPAIVTAKAQVDLRHVAVTFSKPVADNATNLANFSLSGGLSVSRCATRCHF